MYDCGGCYPLIEDEATSELDEFRRMYFDVDKQVNFKFKVYLGVVCRTI